MSGSRFSSRGATVSGEPLKREPGEGGRAAVYQRVNGVEGASAILGSVSRSGYSSCERSAAASLLASLEAQDAARRASVWLRLDWRSSPTCAARMMGLVVVVVIGIAVGRLTM